MKFLQICHKPPYPDSDGGTMAMYGILRSLHESGHRVDVLAVATRKHPEKNHTDPVLKQIDLHHIFVDTRVKKQQVLKGLFDSTSYHLTRFFDARVKSALTEKLQENEYDAVIFESLFTALYLPIVRSVSPAKCIYREHNIESKLWGQRAGEKSGLKKAVLQNFNKKLSQFEYSVIHDFDGIACISDHDKKHLISAGLDVPASTVPVAYYSRSEPRKRNIKYDIGFLGALDWQPNAEGIKHFFQHINPLIQNKLPQVRIAVAGRGNNRKLIRSLPGNVAFLGEVPSSEKFMAECRVLAVPLYSGSGVRIKIIEAAATGTPVVTTPAGIQGLDLGENSVCVSPTDEAFAENLIKLITNPDIAEKQADNAKAFINENLNPAKAVFNFMDLIKSL